MNYTDYYEKKTHGSSSFPLQYYFVNFSHPQYLMPAHWHREFEIIRVLEGELCLLVDTVEYTLTKGDMVFVNCGCLHSGNPQNCVYECIVFDMSMLAKSRSDASAKYLSPLAGQTLAVKTFFPTGTDERISEKVNLLFETVKNEEPFYELLAYSVLYSIFYLLLKSSYTVSLGISAKNREELEAVRNIIEWIENNYSGEISLQKLSAISGLSEKRLCSVFKLYTSRTPIDYVNFYRIECACQCMLSGNMGVTQTAFNCGFNDLSYFIKTFKRYKGVSPKQYALRSK